MAKTISRVLTCGVAVALLAVCMAFNTGCIEHEDSDVLGDAETSYAVSALSSASLDQDCLPKSYSTSSSATGTYGGGAPIDSVVWLAVEDVYLNKHVAYGLITKEFSEAARFVLSVSGWQEQLRLVPQTQYWFEPLAGTVTSLASMSKHRYRVRFTSYCLRTQQGRVEKMLANAASAAMQSSGDFDAGWGVVYGPATWSGSWLRPADKQSRWLLGVMGRPNAGTVAVRWGWQSNSTPEPWGLPWNQQAMSGEKGISLTQSTNSVGWVHDVAPHTSAASQP